MPAETTGKKNDSGFTLLELLVVITILGLILAALTNGVRFAGQAWQAQERRTARQGDLDAVQNILRHLIASGAGFEGDSGVLRFVSTLPEALERGGLYDLDLHAENGQLVLAWRPHFKGPAATPSLNRPSLNRAALANAVARLDIAYYLPPAGWKPALTEKVKPELIRIALWLDDGQPWPPLLVAPMVEVVQGVDK